MTPEEKEYVADYYGILIDKGRKVAEANGMKFSSFKAVVSWEYNTADFTEDRWTYDYQCYLVELAAGTYATPSEWAKDYYGDSGMLNNNRV